MRPCLIFLLCLLSIATRAQIIAPDTVCQYDTVTLSTPYDAATYSWADSIFSVDQYYTPTALSWGFGLTNGAQVEMHHDNGNWYQVVCPWWGTNYIRRASMGTNPVTGSPVYTDLPTGYTVPIYGATTVKDDATGNWYTFASGDDALFRYSYGTSLANTPTVDSIPVLSPLATGIREIIITKYNNEWTGFAIDDGDLVRIDIGTDITNTPVLTKLNIPHYEMGTPNLVEENGQYYLLVITATTTGGHLILRLDLGTDIHNNTPVVTDISDPSFFTYVWNLHVMKDCGKTIATFFDIATGNMMNIDFGSSITNTPVYTSLGTRSVTFPVGCSFVYNNTLYLGYRSNNLDYLWPALHYPTTATTVYHANTARYVFNTPGLRTLELHCNEGNTTKVASFCKQVYVKPSLFNTTAATRDTGLCPGTTRVLDAGSYNGTTYRWNTGATTPAITIAGAGTYWVKVSGSPLCANGTDTIKVKNYTAAYANLGSDTSHCADSAVTLKVIGLPSPGSVYLWSTGATTPAIQAPSGHDYWLEVTNTDGCKKRDTITVNIAPAPTVWLGNDTALCAGAHILLRSNPQPVENTFQWSTGDNTDATVVTDGSVYWLEVTDKKGCKATDTITMYTRTLPNVDLGNDFSVCANDSAVLLTADSANYTYSWSVPGNTHTVTVAPGAQYWVMAVDEYGCRGRDSIDIGAYEVPDVQLGEDAQICPAGTQYSSPLRGSNYTYLWSTGETTPAIQVMPENTYTLHVTDMNGCTGSDEISFTTMPMPAIELGEPEVTLCNTHTLMLPRGSAENGDKYLWSDGSTEATLNVTKPGKYIVAYSNSCYTVYDTIAVYHRNCSIWFPSGFTPNGDGKNDIARALGDLSEISGFRLMIYNRWGNRIYYSEDMYNGWDGTYKGNPQDAGTYNYVILYTRMGNPQKVEGAVTLVR